MVNYGDFKETDVWWYQGTFHASDYALNIGWGYQYNPLFSFGATIKGNLQRLLYLSMLLDLPLIFPPLIMTPATMDNYCWSKKCGCTAEKLWKTTMNHFLLKPWLQFPTTGLHTTSLRFNLTYRHLEKFDMSYSDPQRFRWCRSTHWWSSG